MLLPWLLISACSAASWVATPPDEGPRSYATGLRRPSTLGSWWMPDTPLTTAVHLPSRFDWRTVVGDIPVRNQGACGSCWAFATVAPLEFLLRNASQNVDLSEQFLVSCNNAGFSCVAGGWWAFDTVLGAGLVPEACFPYVARDAACANTCGPLPNAQLARWAYVDRYGGTPSVVAIQQAVLQRGPLAVAVAVGDDFFRYRSGVFDVQHRGAVNHAVVIIGWDDALGAWLLRNSWGVAWGMQGHMWMAYGVSSIGDGAAYATLHVGSPAWPSSAPSPSPSPSPPPPPNRECTAAQTVLCLLSTFTVRGSTARVPPCTDCARCTEPPSEYRGLWFAVTLDDGVTRAEWDSVGSDFDTQMAVYYGPACANTSCIAANDDITPGNTSS